MNLEKIFHLVVVALAGAVVGCADAIIRKVSSSGSVLTALRDPLMLVVVALYAGQILFFTFLFCRGWQLGIVGNLQLVFFSATIVALGRFYFHEALTSAQWVGLGFAVVGAVLMNR